MRHGDDPNSTLTVLVGVIGALVLFAVIALLQAFLYRSEKGESARKNAVQSPDELALLRAEQQEILASYRWVDQPKGVVAIPIERAMELVVRDPAPPATPPSSK